MVIGGAKIRQLTQRITNKATFETIDGGIWTWILSQGEEMMVCGWRVASLMEDVRIRRERD